MSFRDNRPRGGLYGWPRPSATPALDLGAGNASMPGLRMTKPFLEALRQARALVSAASAADPQEGAVARRLTRSLDEAIARFDGSAPGVDPVSVVCHDLKDPLASVVMGTGFLQRVLPSEEDGVRRVVNAIARSADRLGQIITDFHDLAKLDTGRLSIDPHEWDVGTVVGGAVDSFAVRAREREVELAFDPPGEPRVAVCDRVRLLQVVSKVVANAIAFTDAGGRVELGVFSDADWIRVVVSDTGRGIASERLPLIFDHPTNAGRPSRDGPGFGLAIAKGLVDLQRGTIGVTSKVGHGTTVEVTLPRAIPRPRAPV
jgi:signal transduction histidine kinase